MVLLASVLSVSAQIVFPGNNIYSCIPSFATYNKAPLLMTAEDYSYADDVLRGNCNLYDYDLNLVTSLTANDNIIQLRLDEVLDEHGLRFEIDKGYIPFSQTIFNDDEDWEYMEGVYEEKDVTNAWGMSYTVKALKSYKIKNTTGEVISTVDAAKYEIEYIIIIGKTILVKVGEDMHDDMLGNLVPSVYKYYTLPEFRKLVGAASTGIEARPFMVAPAKDNVYDVYGRKASAGQKGIVVRNGKKALQ